MVEDFEYFIDDGQNPKIVQRTYDRISQLLISKEVIDYIAVQKKMVFHPFPMSAVLTNKRLIICDFSLFGSKLNFRDFHWEDILDIHIEEKAFGITFNFITRSRRNFLIKYLSKYQAEEMYRYAQEKAEFYREIRKYKVLIDKRNSLETSSEANGSSASGGSQSIDKLIQLKEMFEKKLISAQEYEIKRNEILDQM